jgi:hypothetical protein
VIFAETSKIGHIDRETGEEADDYVEGLQGRPHAADFGVDIRWALDEGTSTFGLDDSLEETSAKGGVGTGYVYLPKGKAR